MKLLIGNILKSICLYFEKKLLDIQARQWFSNHTIQDFEERMIELGCTVVHTRNSVIFTTPNGKGKIEVTDTELIINNG